MSNDNVRLGREDLLQGLPDHEDDPGNSRNGYTRNSPPAELPGFVHLYAGEEAAATGIMLNLRQDDHIASTHRGHGHCIAKGVDVKGMFAELYGRATGTCRGKGGSMHIADLDLGMMGANGILGAGAPLVCGAALASKYKKDGSVAVSFVGDGASNAGNFLESLNLAAVWDLPGHVRGGNNAYAQSTSRDYAVAVDSYVDRASGFGMPGVTVDGTDFFAVHEAAGEMIARAREGGGPSLLECAMIRFFGHYEGDAQTYRAPGEVEDIRANRDCLTKFVQQVTQAESGRAGRSRAHRSGGRSVDRPGSGRSAEGAASHRGGSPHRRLRQLLSEVTMAQISIREAINQAFDQEMERDPTVILMGEDIAGGTGSPGEEEAWGGAMGLYKGLYKKVWRPRARYAAVRGRVRGRRHRRGNRAACARSRS